ncbi:MAG: hypothetical protein WB992_07550 [Bryobacteraceae bacterium]
METNKRRFLIIAACAFGAAVALNLAVRQCSFGTGIAGHTVSPLREPIPAAVRSLRPNFPYSVIPGGAYSPAELRFANDKDALVREHYADFNVHTAKLVTLTEDRYQYVSFRLKNHIFWTHNRLRIPRGETLLTDGRSYARTRCGNRLSSTKQPNTTPHEPLEALLSLPPYSFNLQLPLAAAPPTGELAQEFPVLPFESERLAPVLPNGTEAAIPLPETLSPIASYPPMTPAAGTYIPTTGKTPTQGGPTSPTIPTSPTSPVISQVPEPASFYLFTLTFALTLWVLGRMVRKNGGNNKRPQDDDESTRGALSCKLPAQVGSTTSSTFTE